MSDRGSFTGDQAAFDGFGMMEAVARELKMESQSPGAGTSGRAFSFSRTSSTGSVHQISCSSASSAHNTDDEDSDGTTKAALSYKDRRREAHTQAEQKRRDAIKKGYEDLQNVIPMCQQADGIGSQKLSKAAILQKSIDYIQYLIQQKKKQEEDVESLRKEVMALKIMKANYEHIVKAHQNTPQQGKHQVSDEVKFQVFQQLMDTLFQSFNASISVANFAELSGCVFSWLEEYCKPQTLRELTLGILRQLNSHLHH
jgi:MAX-like protein X